MTPRHARLGPVALAIAVALACEGKTGAPDGRDYPHVAEVMRQNAPTIDGGRLGHLLGRTRSAHQTGSW